MSVSPFVNAGTAEFEPEDKIWTSKSQYMIPHPVTGKRIKVPRATKYASTISDRTILEMWKMAMVGIAVTKYRDYRALISSEELPEGEQIHWPQGWWRPHYDHCEAAMDRFGAKAGAHEGTGVHRFTEQFDKGKITIRQVPEEWREHIKQYERLNTVHGRGMDSALRERRVLTLKLHNGVCGTFDACRPMHGTANYIIDDTKTGRDAPKGVDEIAIQLAVYANAEWIWEGDAKTGRWVPNTLNIRKDVATITWIPINDPENAQIIPIDIEWGWQAAKVIAWVKGYRNRATRKNNSLILPLSVLDEGYEHVPGDVATPFDYLGRMQLAMTREEVSAVWLEASTAGEATSALESAGHERIEAIRRAEA
jgi:hypothetical protein